MRCLYCGVYLTVDQNTFVPAKDDEENWEKVAKIHTSKCEWVKTRAHLYMTDGYSMDLLKDRKEK